MRVDVSGKQFVFPRQCACCGRYPGTWLTISGTERNRNSKTRGWAWDIPYCKQCRKHVRLADNILIGGLAGVTLSGIAAFVALGTGISWARCLLVLVLGTAVSCLVVGTLLIVQRRRLYGACVSLARSVRYLGSSGSWHSFDFRSQPYLTDFVRSNRHKLVNASATIRSMLKQYEVSEFQVARRLTRKPK